MIVLKNSLISFVDVQFDMEKNTKNILIFAGCSDKKLSSKIMPILDSKEVGKVFVVRRGTTTMNHPKLIYKTPSPIINKLMPLGEIVRFFIAINILFKNRIDLLMGIHLVMHGYYAYILSRLFRKKYIILFIENTLMHKPTSLFRNVVRGAFMNGVRGSSAVDYLSSLGVKKGNIFNPPNEFYMPNVSKIDKDKRKYDIIYVGNLIERKGLDLWIDVVGKVKEKINNVKAVIVGSGPYRDTLEKKVSSLNLQDNVEFAGLQKEVYEFIKQTKMHLLTSYSEGLPMVTVECMAMGLPPVSTNAGDIKDLITNGENGFIIDSRDVDEIAQAVLKVLENDTLYAKLSMNAKKTIEDMSKSSSHENLVDLWSEVLSNV